MKILHKSVGMTFIEVLVSLVILVTGILGAVALQATVKKGSFDAMQRSLAVSLAQDIIERMRSNQASDFFLENYQGVYGASLNAEPTMRCNSPASLCTPVQMVANDLYEWELSLMGKDILSGEQSAGGLVNGRGCIDHNNNQVTVVISWHGRTKIKDGFDTSQFDSTTASFVDACGASSKNRRQVVVQAFIN